MDAAEVTERDRKNGLYRYTVQILFVTDQKHILNTIASSVVDKAKDILPGSLFQVVVKETNVSETYFNDGNTIKHL